MNSSVSLDPLHYYTSPGLALDADLRMPRVDLKLIADKDMYHFVENSIRGGISMNPPRHEQANNPSFPATYDARLPRQDLIYLDAKTSFPATYDARLPRQDLIYLDANNLYGWAMSQSLPTHGFRFLQQEEISAVRLQDLSDNDEDGYILEVDIHYPTSLHDQHDDYPLDPESLVIHRSMYSPTQQ